ncbi:Ribose transport system permease protein RbsC [Ruegeria sp. THAF57]|uniref:ABC transporter permease n=1 Tax=Ruegeria sp. THAF57 TaxID=2744555 RepID=UPI0015DDEB26|nr:ABC transporter permease [Ruegeria sp. THAF57]CAD0183873.1 Ribose transport system permease protein RbsC [Ruegeria sp. THAF57]
MNIPRPKNLAALAPFLLLLVAIAVYVTVAIATGQTQYLTAENLLGLLGRSIALGITAIGQTFAILIASIDLSVANLISVSAVLASSIMSGDPSMMLPAIAAVLAVGVVVGLINGLVITQFEVNPLIATLGMALILQGLLSATFNNFAGEVPEEFQVFAYGQVGGISISLIFLIALTVAAWVFLRFTRAGSNIYSVGGNPDASKLAGMRTTRVVIMAHVICSVCATIAGLYLASRLRSGAPWIGRDGVYDLESIAVVVIGGTALSGGRGGVWGTLMGVMIFSLIDSIFNIAGVDAYAKQILRGVIIVAAVAVYAVRSRRIEA